MFPLKTFASLLTAVVLLLGTASCGNEREDTTSGEEELEEGSGYTAMNDTQRVTNTDNTQMEETFERWDSSGDQRLSRDEFNSAATSLGLYSAWDKNDDNLLTVSELSEGIFNIYDENNDNMLDKEEFSTWNNAWGRDYEDSWDAWDTDNDNKLTAEEFMTGFDEAGVFDRWDTVDDNVYTKEEVFTALFASLDTGGDGYLTEEEFRQVGNYFRGI